MDIFTHTLSGLAAGTLMAGFSSKNWKGRSAIILFSGLGGALPDIDAISMSRRFDGTIGKLFGLEHTGRVIYSEKFWYSHHGFMHSLMAAVLIAVIIGLLFYLFRYLREASFLESLKDKSLLLGGFVLAFVIHLLQDMITPASAWGGVRIFFPSATYIGGTGNIWWWNNYNLFLVVATVLFLNLALLLFLPRKLKQWKFTTPVFLLGICLFMFQMKQINYDFNGNRYEDCERRSKEIQRTILGEPLYKVMEKVDRSLKFHF